MATAASREPPTGEGLTFEKVWAMFQETDRQSKETDRRLKEAERLIARNGRQIGGLHRSFGEMAEHLVAPGIEARFNEMGYHFGDVTRKGYYVKDRAGKILTEIDILLENGETIIVVEVKAKPALKDIEHHIKRLEILRDHRIEMDEKRKKILGAVAGAIYENDVKKAVREAGLFVLEQSGDTMKLDMPAGFVPQEW
jgi:Holliday junction resolvase-like predicted endonuclease